MIECHIGVEFFADWNDLLISSVEYQTSDRMTLQIVEFIAAGLNFISFVSRPLIPWALS
jgi:hypothetical protein